MKKIFLIFFFCLLFLFPIVLVGAQENPCVGGLVPCGRSCDDPTTPDDETEPCTLCHFFVMLDRWIDGILFIVVPPLAVLMIAIGGFMYIIAYVGAGGPEMVSRAKKLFTAVAIGLLIIYSAWVFLGLFFQVIGLNPKWTLPIYRSWWEKGFFEIQCESSSGGTGGGGGIFPGGGDGTFKGSGATGSIPAPESPPDCGSCGAGVFNLCDEEECKAIKGCVFVDPGARNCVALNDCEKCGAGLTNECNAAECKKIGSECEYNSGWFGGGTCEHK